MSRALFGNFLERVNVNGVQQLLAVSPEDAARMNAADMQNRRARIAAQFEAQQRAIEAAAQQQQDIQRLNLQQQEADRRAILDAERLGLDQRRMSLAEQQAKEGMRLDRRRFGLDEARFRNQVESDRDTRGLRRDQFGFDQLESNRNFDRALRGDYRQELDQDRRFGLESRRQLLSEENALLDRELAKQNAKLNESKFNFSREESDREYKRMLQNDRVKQDLDQRQQWIQSMTNIPGMFGVPQAEARGLAPPGSGYDYVDPETRLRYDQEGVKTLDEQIGEARNYLMTNEFEQSASPLVQSLLSEFRALQSQRFKLRPDAYAQATEKLLDKFQSSGIQGLKKKSLTPEEIIQQQRHVDPNGNVYLIEKDKDGRPSIKFYPYKPPTGSTAAPDPALQGTARPTILEAFQRDPKLEANLYKEAQAELEREWASKEENQDKLATSFVPDPTAIRDRAYEIYKRKLDNYDHFRSLSQPQGSQQQPPAGNQPSQPFPGQPPQPQTLDVSRIDPGKLSELSDLLASHPENKAGIGVEQAISEAMTPETLEGIRSMGIQDAEGFLIQAMIDEMKSTMPDSKVTGSRQIDPSGRMNYEKLTTSKVQDPGLRDQMGQLPVVKSPEDFALLPPGPALFLDENGVLRKKLK